MADTESIYRLLLAELREIALLSSVSAVLGWDDRTQMPIRGAAHRADQLCLLARQIHQRFTSPQIGDWLSELEARDLDDDATVNVRETRRRYDRSVKIPQSLVEEETRITTMAHQAWVDARKQSDFSAFAPWLEKILPLKLQRAKCLGYAVHPYDALLDLYEPDETTAHLTQVFESLRDPLVELIAQIKDSPPPAPVEILRRRYPIAQQEALARAAATAIGFNFDAGRLDVSVHPFCTGLGPSDTRMTTRYNEYYFRNAFFGTLHETGHGLYDQGLPAQHFGTPLGSSVSLGIHESQSRMWENLVGRSRSFWTFFLPKARQAFPEALGDVSDDQWYRAINGVSPSLIRVDADETTYNLHILIRFELEQAMMTGDLSVADLPGAWNERMKKYLGIAPPDAAQGVLQDVHWSSGSIGYFPTYMLGNLYAAQFFETARSELGDLDAQFAAGEFSPLLQWLRKKIHQHGKRYSAGQLAMRITGQSLSAQPLLRHLKTRAGEIYRLA
jgi:carboxypeptidase Taq